MNLKKFARKPAGIKTAKTVPTLTTEHGLEGAHPELRHALTTMDGESTKVHIRTVSMVPLYIGVPLYRRSSIQAYLNVRERMPREPTVFRGRMPREPPVF